MRTITSRTVCALALGLLPLVAACDTASSPTSPSGTAPATALETMLERAILDEYQAETIYQGVLDDFGQVLPFVNVLTAEERHSASVARLYAARALAAPANPYSVSGIAHFSSVQAACAAGVTAEQANISLYDALLAGDLPTDVRQVFTNNRAASLNNHLPAFQRCS